MISASEGGTLRRCQAGFPARGLVMPADINVESAVAFNNKSKSRGQGQKLYTCPILCQLRSLWLCSVVNL